MGGKNKNLSVFFFSCQAPLFTQPEVESVIFKKS